MIQPNTAWSSYLRNLKQTHKSREKIGGCQGVGGGRNRELMIKRLGLSYASWVSPRDLLNSSVPVVSTTGKIRRVELMSNILTTVIRRGRKNWTFLNSRRGTWWWKWSPQESSTSQPQVPPSPCLTISKSTVSCPAWNKRFMLGCHMDSYGNNIWSLLLGHKL